MKSQLPRKKVIIANDKKIVSFVLDGNRLYYCVDNALLYDYEYGKDSFIAIYDMSDKSSRTVLEYSAVESRMVNSSLRDFLLITMYCISIRVERH